MTVQLITFDLDDTLWDNGPVIIAAEQAFARWLQENTPLGADQLLTIRRQLVQQYPVLKHRLATQRQKALQQGLIHSGYSEEQARQLASQGFRHFQNARHQLQPFAETLPLLQTLQKHYRLGVITNGTVDIRRLGLEPYFCFSLSAEDMGISKPDPAIFHHALHLAGVAAETAVHIGDDPEKDVEGARQAGLRALWFNPARYPWPGNDPEPPQTTSLAAIPELLKNS